MVPAHSPMTSAAAPAFQQSPGGHRHRRPEARQHRRSPDAPQLPPGRHPEHPGHLQKLPVRPPDARKDVGVHRRKGHEARNHPGEGAAVQQHQNQDDKGHHRHRLHRRYQRRQQLLHRSKPGRGRRQGHCQQTPRQPTAPDAQRGTEHCGPKVGGTGQAAKRLQRRQRRGQQQRPVGIDGLKRHAPGLPHPQPHRRRPHPAHDPFHLTPRRSRSRHQAWGAAHGVGGSVTEDLEITGELLLHLIGR